MSWKYYRMLFSSKGDSAKPARKEKKRSENDTPTPACRLALAGSSRLRVLVNLALRELGEGLVCLLFLA
jgi:hypothetical protein